MGRHLSKAETNEATYSRTFPFELRTGHLQIPVKVNGAGFLFYLDTGAPTAVSRKLARTLKTKSVKLGNRVDTLVTIDDLQFGGMRYSDVGGILLNTAELFKRSCATIDGLVGANAMSKSVWQIDYANRQITVSSKLDGLNHVNGAIKIPFNTTPFTNTPILALTLDNGQTVNLVYDTGFNGFITLNTNDAKTFLNAFDKTKVTKALSIGYTSILGDSVANTIDTTYIIQTNVQSGSDFLGNVPITFGRYKNYSDEKHGVIGNEFFENSVVTLDWNSKTLFVQSPTPVTKAYETWGFSFGFQDDDMIVGSLVQGSDAQKQGVSIGDKIIRINGIDIDSLTEQQRCEFNDGTYALISEDQPNALFTIVTKAGQTQTFAFKRLSPVSGEK